jgi:hypothetical protein
MRAILAKAMKATRRERRIEKMNGEDVDAMDSNDEKRNPK